MEIWDAYDKNCNKIEGVKLARGLAIPKGYFHLVSDVLLRHIDGEILIMLRDPRKHYGGLWEATSGGSALSGETPLDCAIRELREETGILATDFVNVGREISEENRSIYYEFTAVTNCEKDSVVCQVGETVDYKWVTVENLKTMSKNQLLTERMKRFVDDLQ